MGRFSGSDVLLLSRSIRRGPCARASVASHAERLREYEVNAPMSTLVLLVVVRFSEHIE